jgi:cytochrome c biogenesis protein CcmG, thiol:disulfide interchange protein DsbE
MRAVTKVRIVLWLPLAAFLLVLVLVATGLIRPHSSEIRSQMIDKPLPAFSLPAVRAGQPPLTSAATGQARLVNVFASWCVPCAQEAPQLMALRQAGVAIDGIAIRDRPADTLDFLARNGDPFARIGRDDAAAVQVALGSSGVPETFVVDGKGVIVRQHIGAIGPQDVPDILAAVQAAR